VLRQHGFGKIAHSDVYKEMGRLIEGDNAIAG
jgi:hypothetical protein